MGKTRKITHVGVQFTKVSKMTACHVLACHHYESLIKEVLPPLPFLEPGDPRTAP